MMNRYTKKEESYESKLFFEAMLLYSPWINQKIYFIFRDCNWTRTKNHLVRKRTLNHLAKWAR